MVLSASLFNST